MAKSYKYRMEMISGQDNTFSDSRKDSYAGTNSTTILESASPDIKMTGGLSSSVTVNFQGLTNTKVLSVRSPVSVLLKLSGGSETIPLTTFAGSEAIAFMTTSATALTIIKNSAASALINVRLEGV